MKKLHDETQALQKCRENVLHEDEMRYRAQSMTAAHYESLRRPFVEIAGRKWSAMLQWLQLFVNSANPGGNELNHRKKNGYTYIRILIHKKIFLLKIIRYLYITLRG